MLPPKLIVTLIPRPIGPSVHSISMLPVILPSANILGAVGMLVDAVAVGPVVQPLAEVVVAVGVDHAALAGGLVGVPVALVFAAVLPVLNAFALAEAGFGPLAGVDGAVVELKRPPLNQLLILSSSTTTHRHRLVIHKWSQPLLGGPGVQVRLDVVVGDRGHLLGRVARAEHLQAGVLVVAGTVRYFRFGVDLVFQDAHTLSSHVSSEQGLQLHDGVLLVLDMLQKLVNLHFLQLLHLCVLVYLWCSLVLTSSEILCMRIPLSVLAA